MGNIQLQSQGFNQWLDQMEMHMTCIKDVVNVLFEEAEYLEKAWESGAGFIWKNGFQDCLFRLQDGNGEMQKHVIQLLESAKELEKLEMEMAVIADG